MSGATMREAAARAAVDLFVEDTATAIVLADISLDLFRPALRHDPARAVNVGIMEQAAVGVAAGLALEGFRPVVHTLAPFLAERPLEQLKLDFGYQRLGGLFVAVGGSYDYSTAGGTHHAPGDVAAVSTVPGMEVLVPGSAAEAAALVRGAHGNGRPTYVRTSVVEHGIDVEPAPGGLAVVRRGRGPTVVAVGPMLGRTLVAVDGLDATVLYATTVVPLDAAVLAATAGPLVVVVEPFLEGTLAPQVAAALAHRASRIVSIGVPAGAIHAYGTIEQLDGLLGLDAASVRRRIERAAGA